MPLRCRSFPVLAFSFLACVLSPPVRAGVPVQLEVDGALVLSSNDAQSRAAVRLTKGWHPVRGRFQALYAASEIHWWWLRPGEREGEQEIVGEEYLRH